MKYLVLCEGQNEHEIMNILLENDLLTFTENDLLGLNIYHARQITSSALVKTELNIYPGKVSVYRIGDIQSEKIRIPIEYKEKITSVTKYCTKPELEILLIIAEGLFFEYTKRKSKTKPKTFAKQYIRCGKKKYDNSTVFYRKYFGNNPDLLVSCIREYKRINGAHKSDEGYLADLLK
ncbi:MAG: GNAT family acetyltransferase [Holdemanella sp.]|nr:GNAT family acetyltransferase [Holdemanella sp.]